VRTLLPAHDAQEIKTLGDAILLGVDDGARAVDLATRILMDRSARHGTLGVRIGIHTGTAIRRGDDWFGSGVNLAARVADLAQAGEVLLTEATRQRLGPDAPLHDRGPHTLKNVPRPVGISTLDLDMHRLDPLPLDPVCHMAVDPARAAARQTVGGIEYVLCSERCAQAFAADPSAYVGDG